MSTEEKAREIAAARLRRTLYWMKKPLDTPEMRMGIQVVVSQQYWKDWGYPRLLECLLEELKMPLDPAVEITKEAIKNGYEDKQRYHRSQEANATTD